ncbi:LuxR C-terminal-related transcriptional regulator [Nonomuraea sp. NBC_01738]|uniref:helix-turn-helix transcriptional regulator n=1 Tax=Nonomuraea sp. NBC_01738 TaxID=2976003 RepID=UPI002E13FE3C|nr:LuxR C-terminal-related transcriptional regulator [Nonomuraea sp. NBC_01738]
MLYGRATEQAAIEGLRAAARDGLAGALVIRGEAGIGKTALLDWAAATADQGLRVLRVVGIEPEADLAFGGLSQLLWPLQERLDALAPPQSAALKSVLGAGGATPGRDRFVTGLALLTLLADLAEERPVLCLVDDAQWLDRASAEALLFAARRLAAERVAMVFATRDDGFAAPGLTELRPSRLDGGDARRLLAERQVSPQLREQLVTESDGNPLALIEFAAAQRGTVAWPQHLRVADRVLSSFRAQVGRLPEGTRTMLLVAAAEGRGDLPIQLTAAQSLGAGLDDLADAERAGLVRLTEASIAFRHPLIATAAYQGAPLARRVAVHGALAAVSPSADCRARHLPAATVDPDAGIASELAEAAARAEARTAYTASARLYEQAARLAERDADRLTWLTAGAAAALAGGNHEHVAGLTAKAEALEPPAGGSGSRPREQALSAVSLLRATAMFELGDRDKAVRLLLDRGSQAHPGRAHPAQAATMLLTGATYAWLACDAPSVARAARELRLLGRPDQMADGLDRLMRGDYREGLPLLEEFLATTTDTQRALYTGLLVGADETTAALAEAEIARCREQGLIGDLPRVLRIQAQTRLWAGDHAEAIAATEEAAALACDTGAQQRLAWLNAVPARIAAIEGDAARCHALLEAAPDEFRPISIAILSLLDLATGDHEAVLDRLEAAWKSPGSAVATLVTAVPDQIESAVRLARPHRAAAPLDHLRSWAEASTQPWAKAALLRCLALLADDEARYRQAAEVPGDRPFERARTLLLLGEHLRRARRPSEARTPLRQALDTFTRLNATPWITRTRAELQATGDTERTETPATPTTLTPQELQVVRLAATGHSSREIAAQLFLSPRTVEYHLYKAYPKLGVSSRRELSRLDLAPQ